jgi:hypothetical protein
MGNLGPNFYPKLVQMASRLQTSPEFLLNVMTLESGLNPAARNPNGGAAGLVQFMSNTLKGVQFKGTSDDFLSLSGENQLDYVEKLIRSSMALNGGPFTSATQYYVSNLWPVGLKLPGVKSNDPAAVILEKNPLTVVVNGETYSKKYLDIGHKIKASFEISAYKNNRGLDADKDGTITFGDLSRVLDKAANTQVYRNALAEMKKTTGYEPSTKETMIAKNNPGKSWHSKDTMTSKYLANDLSSILESFIKQIAASEKLNKKLYKQYLPQQHFIIQIATDDFTSGIEFATVLQSALKEELMANANIHTDNSCIEIQCDIYGPKKESFEALNGICTAIEDAFYNATKKIGHIKANTTVVTGNSIYPELNVKIAEIQHNKFLLRFI